MSDEELEFLKNSKPERISQLHAIGTRNLFQLTENGLEREVHLSIFDEFDREMCYKLVGANKWTPKTKFELEQAVNDLARIINRVNHFEPNVHPDSTDDQEGSQPGNLE